MSEYTAQDVENAREIASATNQTVEQVEEMATEYAAQDGETVSEELEDGAMLAEFGLLSNIDDEEDNDL